MSISDLGFVTTSIQTIRVLHLAEWFPRGQHRSLPSRVRRESGTKPIEGLVAGWRISGRHRSWVFLSDVMRLRHDEVQAVPRGVRHEVSVPKHVQERPKAARGEVKAAFGLAF
jgi:hypothetical protein